MFLTENDFKNKYIVRVGKGIPKRITTLTNGVPKNPIYHYSVSGEHLGPEPTDLVVNAINEVSDELSIYVSHVVDLPIDNEKDKGYFGRKGTDGKRLVQDYHKRYRQFMRVFDAERVLSKNSPLIINYQLLPKLYPIKVRRPDTYKWVEDQFYESIWQTATSLDTDRVQFISISPPRILKNLEYYHDLIRFNSVTALRKINNREDLILLDLLAFYSGLKPKEETIIGKYLGKGNITLALRDDINVFYLDSEKLLEFMEEDSNEKSRLLWIYNLFEHLVGLRPALVDEDIVEYKDKIEEIKAGTKKELGLVDDYGSLVLDEANDLLQTGSITEGEYKGNLKLAAKYKNLPNPLGDGKLEDLINTPKQITTLPSTTVPGMKAVTDKSILSNTVKLLDEDYISNHLEPDIIRTVMELQREGIIITNIKTEVVEDVSGKVRVYRIQTKPVKGDIATFKMEVPIVNPNGTFRLGGVNYRMNKQRNELPIVKFEPTKVALTSAQCKLFVSRGTRRAYNASEWLYVNLLNLKETGHIEDVIVGNVARTDIDLDLPDTYTILGKRFKTFKVKGYAFNFDYTNRESLLGKSTVTLKSIEKHGILVGKSSKGMLLMDSTNNIVELVDKKITTLGTIEEIIGLDKGRRPLEYSDVKIRGKVIPVGMLLTYYLGIEGMFKYLGIKYTEHELNERLPDSDSIIIKFRDVKLAITVETKLQELIVGGLVYFKDGLKETNLEELNSKRNYLALLKTKGIGQGQIKGYERIRRFWVDPNTRELLIGMNEPTNMIDIFIRATELLTTQQHSDESDGNYKINKGYTRFSDIIYKELIIGIDELNRGNTTAKRIFSINPYAVRKAIAMDSGISPIEETNPMQVIGEQERITYGGSGGRSNQSLVGRHRRFHKNDRGTISEGFTDDGKAGTVYFYTANPTLENIYGKANKDGSRDLGNLLGNSTLVNPFSLTDDPKRSNFARIHYNAWVNSVGQMSMPTRTGAELVMAHKAGDKFAVVSRGEGKVTVSDDKKIVLLYKDGSEDKFPLGRLFGNSAGKTIPQKRITDRAKGYKFERGEVIAWNPYFFERDWIEDKQVAMLTGVPANVVLRESIHTYEDSSRQSQNFANKLASETSHIRDILVKFDDNVRLSFKVGDTVESDSTLANILPVGVDFTEDDNSLDYHSNTAAKAKYSGTIEQIEVIYCGSLDEASSSVKGIIQKGDRTRKEQAAITGEVSKGNVLEPTYIGQNFVDRNTCLVRVYITELTTFKRGDKAGFVHACKFTSSGTWDTIYETEKGLPIDAEFSYQGLLARILNSPTYLGICNAIVREIGLGACEVYEGKKKI